MNEIYKINFKELSQRNTFGGSDLFSVIINGHNFLFSSFNPAMAFIRLKKERYNKIQLYKNNILLLEIKKDEI